MSTLKGLKAREVLDSRGRPTVEVEAIASTGAVGRAIVPSGASTGRHEALELRDGERPPRRPGGAAGRRERQRRDRPGRRRHGPRRPGGLDARLIALDGTPNKTRLGANAVLGVSLAVAHAAAAARGEELYVHLNRLWRHRLDDARRPRPRSPPSRSLPMPMVNMISGGLHAGGNLDFQDFLMIPVGAPSYSEALEMTVAGLPGRRRACWTEGEPTAQLVGDEGGYGPASATTPRPSSSSSRPSSPAASSRARRGHRARRRLQPLLRPGHAVPTASTPPATTRSTPPA